MRSSRDGGVSAGTSPPSIYISTFVPKYAFASATVRAGGKPWGLALGAINGPVCAKNWRNANDSGTR